jgi:hypothetical protein
MALTSQLATESTLLEAAKRRLVRDQVVVVDPDGTGLDLVRYADGGVEVGGVDGGSET